MEGSSMYVVYGKGRAHTNSIECFSGGKNSRSEGRKSQTRSAIRWLDSLEGKRVPRLHGKKENSSAMQRPRCGETKRASSYLIVLYLAIGGSNVAPPRALCITAALTPSSSHSTESSQSGAVIAFELLKIALISQTSSCRRQLTILEGDTYV